MREKIYSNITFRPYLNRNSGKITIFAQCFERDMTFRCSIPQSNLHLEEE